MKSNDIKALHQKTIIELEKELTELSLKLAQARLQKGAQKLQSVSIIATLSDDVARIKTVLTQKRAQTAA